jgi:hypothetical protein
MVSLAALLHTKAFQAQKLKSIGVEAKDAGSHDRLT